MRKIKLKLTTENIIRLCSLVMDSQGKITQSILLDVKEIQVYRLESVMKLHRRLYIKTLQVTTGKFSHITFNLTEQLTMRYCLIHSERDVEMQEIFTTIDKSIHPSMFERNERFA